MKVMRIEGGFFAFSVRIKLVLPQTKLTFLLLLGNGTE